MIKVVPSPSALIGDAIVETMSRELGKFEDALDAARQKPDNFDEIAVAALLWMAVVCGYDVIPVERMVDKIRAVYAELKELSEPSEAAQ